LRNQKLRDAALLLPIIGAFLMLPVVLRLVSGGHWLDGVPSLPTFLYAVWFVLIVAAGILARMLLTAEAEPNESGESGEGGRS
jgi:hypothetical protein